MTSPAVALASGPALAGLDAALLDLLPAGVYVCDAGGAVVSYNRRAAEFWGRQPRIGAHGDRFTGAHRVLAADGSPLAPDRTPMAQVLRSGETIHDHELILERCDGSRLVIRASVEALRDETGRITGAVAVFQDVTSRKLAEFAAARQQSESHFRHLLEKLPAGAYTCDRTGLITFYNSRAESVWGRTPRLNDPADRYCGSFRLYSPDGSPIAHDRCWMALALHNAREYLGHEIVVERPDGSRRTVLTHASPLFEGPRTLIGAVNVLVDITEQKDVEAALREADRRKDEFLAILAHELRNPLAPISNSLQSLRLADGAPAVAEQVCDVLDRQVRSLVRLVDDLLDVSRIGRGKLILKKERVSLAAVTAAAVETSRPLLEAANHELTVTLPAEPLFLDADPARLAQVLANLLNNAAKYTEPGGRVALTAVRQGDRVAVTVRDNGVGLAPEVLARIFDPFYQVARDQGRSQGGLGVGLSLVRALVEMHGGTVAAHSDGPGRGSAFVVTLPLASLTNVPSDQPRRRAARTLPPRRILVVDDNQDAAESLAMLLELLGQEVRTAHDGPTALEAAGDFAPEVAFLDIGLPGMSGHDLARRLRAAPGGAGLLLVALTGWGQEEDRRRSAEAGFDHHLTKPADPRTLEALLLRAGERGA